MATAEPLVELVQQASVEQAIDGRRYGRFDKEILRAVTPSGRALAVVRKRRTDVARRGAVLLVHGFAQNRYSWHLSTRSFVNYLADEGFDVFNLELTGHGRSREYGTTAASSFDDYVDDASSVVDSVCAYAGVEDAFVIGHSLGGAVCYAAASRVPHRIAGLVSVAGLYSFGANSVTRGVARFLEALKPLLPVVRRFRAGVASRFLGRAIVDRLEQTDRLFGLFPMAGWVPGSTEPHVLQERLIRGFDWTGLNILLTMLGWAADGSFEGESGVDYAEAFSKLDIPLLVIAGDRDRLLPPADARPAYDLSASRDKTYKLFSPVNEEVHWGHLDIVLGEKAPKYVWPYVARWLLDRSPLTQ
ncbi:MAG: alpha/beta fold hydrolase [Deltaproteobacteria bacterium]|nr:alpha/beta fold hydrolase [Deltaproteobacteria bacterium]